MALAGDRNRHAQQLFAPLPERYDLLAEVLSFGSKRPMARRHGRPGRSRRPGTRVLDVATGTAGVAMQLAARTAGSVVGADLTLGMLRGGAAPARRLGLSRADPARRRPGRAAAVPGCQLRRPDLHLPAALCRRSGRHPPGARPGGQARGDHGQPGLPGPAPAVLAGMVVDLHAWRAAGGGPGDRRPAVVPGGPFPRARIFPSTTGGFRWRRSWTPGVGPASTTSGSAP